MIPHSSIHKKHFDIGEKTDVVFLIGPLRYNPLHCMLHLLCLLLTNVRNMNIMTISTKSVKKR